MCEGLAKFFARAGSGAKLAFGALLRSCAAAYEINTATTADAISVVFTANLHGTTETAPIIGSSSQLALHLVSFGKVTEISDGLEPRQV